MVVYTTDGGQRTTKSRSAAEHSNQLQTDGTKANRMRYGIFLAVALYVFWLLLSGYWDHKLLLSLGLASTALAFYLAWKIEKRYPFLFISRITTRIPAYWSWLVVEVIKANIDVLKRIWMPKRYPISPDMCVLPMSQRSRIGRTLYANSITLTPGTVSIDVDENEVLVHALSKEGLDDLRSGEMDRRVTALEGDEAHDTVQTNTATSAASARNHTTNKTASTEVTDN